MSAASEFIKNKPVLSYALLLITFSILSIVSIALFEGNIREEIPSFEYIDSRIDTKIQAYDSIHMKQIEPKLDAIIILLGGDPEEISTL